MRKRLLKTITVLCLLCGFFVPVKVSADTATYYQYNANECISVTLNLTNGATRYIKFTSSLDYRFVQVHALNGTYQIYPVTIDNSASKSNIGYNSSSSSMPASCPASYSFSALYKTYNSNIFYYEYSIFSATNSPVSGFPVVEYDTSLEKTLWEYSYGDLSVDPAPPGPDYGNLIDVKFNTDIAGSGTAAVNNIDHIKWNPENDSNGNTFDGSERVQIKAIAGNYTSNSRNGILGLGATDFDYNSGEEHMLAEYPVSRGYYDVSWSHVITQLNAGSISDFLNIRLKGDDIWLKSGWIYQIRLVAGEYTSEWQTIYNATSSGVENSLTVENSTEINMELVNVIQSINTMNSSQNENWTINNITINMENSDGQQTTDKPWWAYLLEAIVKAFGDILAFLGNLIGDLMNAITDLFKPAEFTINEYNDFKVEIKQNSGLFGQAIDFTNDLKNTFMGVQYQEPILHWQGINFGDTVFIPAADYNLNDYVTMWGLGDFRQIAYICSDGFIFFSLLLLIIRKLNEVLKK